MRSLYTSMYFASLPHSHSVKLAALRSAQEITAVPTLFLEPGRKTEQNYFWASAFEDYTN